MKITKPKELTLDERILRVQKSTRTLFGFAPFIRIHNKFRARSTFYYKWHVNPISTFVHYAILVFCVVAVGISVFLNLPHAYAQTYTKTWDTKADFETNTVSNQVDTAALSGSVKLQTNPSPAITFNSKFGTAGTGDTNFTLNYLSGIAVDSVGNRYICDSSNNRVKVYKNDNTFLGWIGSPVNGSTYWHNPSSGVTANATLLSGPNAIAIDGSDNLYVADGGHQVIRVFSSNGTYIRDIGGAGSGDGKFGSNLYSVSLDASGNVYGLDANTVSPRVEVFTSAGIYTRKFALSANYGAGGSPHAMVVSKSNGEIFVTNSNLQNINVYNNDGSAARTIPATSSWLYAIAQDASGNIYYDYSPTKIYVIDPANGNVVRNYTSSGGNAFAYVAGIAVDNTAGQIIVSDWQNNRVQVLNNASNFYSPGTISGTGFTVNGGAAAIWQSITVNASSIPTGTEVKFRLKTSDDGSSWSAWGNYYTASQGTSTLNLSEASTQYAQIEATLTGGNATPQLDDFTLTYVVNAPPTVSAVTAVQSTDPATFGKVNVGYTVADSDSLSNLATIYYFYSTGITLSGPITATTPGNTGALSVSNTNNIPSAGTVIIDNEMISYTGKGTNTLTGITRAALSSTAASHIDTAAIFTKCTTTTGTGSEASGVGGTAHTGTWDVKTDLDNVNLSGVTLKVVANDGEAANMVASANSSTFNIETKNPVAGGTPFRINAGAPKTNNTAVTLNFSATDDSDIQIAFSENQDSLTDFVSYAATKPFTLSSGDGSKTVYSKFRDIYGNNLSSTYSATIELDTVAPTPLNPVLFDVSNPGGSAYKLLISWDILSNNDFVTYSLERSVDDANNFVQVAAFSNISTNAYADNGLSTSHTYYYRLRSQDDIGNWSGYSDTVSMRPQGTDQTPPIITGSNPNVTPSDKSATVSWTTNENSDSFVEFGMTTSYGSTQGKVESTMSHSATIVNLTPDTNYHLRVRSRDVAGNLVVGSDIAFRTDVNHDDVTAPVLVGDNPGITSSDTYTTITWETNEVSDSFVEFGADTNYGHSQGKIEAVTDHSVTLSSLTPLTTYHFRVLSRDLSGNLLQGLDHIFTTEKSRLDTTPPEITGPDPEATPEVTKATISWLTDENTDSFVEFGESVSYGFIQGIVEEKTNHTLELIGLVPNTSYHFRVRARDNVGNLTIGSDYTFRTLQQEVTSLAPSISGATAQKPGADPEEVTIVWTTDMPTTSQVLYGLSDSNLDQATVEDINLNTTHYVVIKKLKPNTKYYYRARSADQYGKEKVDEVKYFVTSDTNMVTTPSIANIVVSNITLTSAIISWKTTTVSTSVVEYGKDLNYGSKIEDQSLGSTTKHTVILNDLGEGMVYHFRVSGLTPQMTAVVANVDLNFSTLSIPSLANVTVKNISSDQATVTWSTNTEADSFVDIILANGKIDKSVGRSEEVRDHAVTLNNLTPNMTYTIKAKSRDKYSNQGISDTKTFKTIIDTTPPLIKDLKSEISIITDTNGESKAQVIISWSTDEPATSQIKYSQGVVVGDSYPLSTQEDTNLTTSHVIILSGLQPSSTYHIKIVSKDSSNNIGVSDDYTVLTLNQDKSLLQYIVQILQERFSWMKSFGMFK